MVKLVGLAFGLASSRQYNAKCPGALGALPGLPRARVREVIRIMDTWPRSERFIRRETEIDGIGGERAPLSANSANSAAFEAQSGRSRSTAGTALNAP